MPLSVDLLENTHEVNNQPALLENFNLFETDTALCQSVQREGGEWAMPALHEAGALAGSAESIALGFAANDNPPSLRTHDRYGRRIDEVRSHPAYHQLMARAIDQGLHASPWTDPRPGAHVARAAGYYLHTQVEAAHGCPITMTFAAIAALRHQPDLYQHWAPGVLSREYDPRNIPAHQKHGLTIGMAMTEKQGGSDVRSNSTWAEPVDQSGPGKAYRLIGHKWFVSAPMCDAFLVLAQAPGGLSCFLLPRWRPDGSKNPLQLQQLKLKMGNVANASSETELRGALAWMVGEEGKGVRTILDMVSMTRYDCMIGSSAGMRQALIQAIHHCSQRRAFGARLTDQPLMQNLLADLALESEAAMTMTLRLSRAMDNQHDQHERLLARILTPVGKYWICKRTPQHAYEAMECIGGSGVMEDCIMPRLFRESPVNAIWEGSGNIQCLDVLRVAQRDPESLQAMFGELNLAAGGNRHLDQAIKQLQQELRDTTAIEYRARTLVDQMALALQASLLVRHAPAAVADAFCGSRLAQRGLHNYGALPHGSHCREIIQRAWPHD